MKENFKIFFALIEKVTCKDQKIAPTLKSLGISLFFSMASSKILGCSWV